MQRRAVFALVYLLVDILYVTLSQPTYVRAVRAIQGEGFPSFTASRRVGAAIAYAALVTGWFVFAAPLATQWARRYPPALAGALAGALYGLVVYGVFNGTLHVMFGAWDVAIALRDMAWGITWGAALTAAYAAYAAK
jgi:uncharacterized membrane protein